MDVLTDEEFWEQFDTIMARYRAGEITKAATVQAVRELTAEPAPEEA